MYASSTGALHMRSQAVPPPYVKGLGEYLRRAGYYTFNRAKTDYNISATPTDDANGAVLANTVPLGAWDASGAAASWRDREPGQPFFGVISPQVTHESRLFASSEAFAKEATHLSAATRHDPARAVLPPYYPDTPAARANWARYYDMWTEADAQVADILQSLDDDGLTRDTLVIFASDHGRGFPRAKRWAYDAGIRVPLIVRWPGRLRAGETRDDLVSFIDLPTTTLALAGVPVPAHFQGRVFLGPTRAADRNYVFVHRDRLDAVPDTIRAVRDRRFKYIRNFFPDRPYAQRLDYAEQVPMLQEWRRALAAGLLEAPQRLFFADRKPAEELYDTATDPHELRNLAEAPAHAPRLRRLRRVLEEWMTETRDLGLVPEARLRERMRPGGRWSTAAAPAISPAGGDLSGPVQVTLSCATDAATVVYTTADTASPRWHLYTGPFVVDAPVTLRVVCARLGFRNSDERVAVFRRAP